MEEQKTDKEFYLSVKLAGHQYVSAFKNKDRVGQQPHYKGDGIAIWVHERKNKDEEKEPMTAVEEMNL